MTRNEFVYKFSTIYYWLLRNKKMHILDEVLPCDKTIVPVSEIRKAALLYKSRFEFQKFNRRCYFAARRLNILDDICKHMNIMCIKWTDETAKREALKFNSRSEFNKRAGGAYEYLRTKGILNNACKHMINREKYVKCIETGKIFISIKKANNFAGATISRSLSMGIKAGGYHWSYCDSEGNIIDNNKKTK
jgi:hypothetical protein